MKSVIEKFSRVFRHGLEVLQKTVDMHHVQLKFYNKCERSRKTSSALIFLRQNGRIPNKLEQLGITRQISRIRYLCLCRRNELGISTRLAHSEMR